MAYSRNQKEIPPLSFFVFGPDQKLVSNFVLVFELAAPQGVDHDISGLTAPQGPLGKQFQVYIVGLAAPQGPLGKILGALCFNFLLVFRAGTRFCLDLFLVFDRRHFFK